MVLHGGPGAHHDYLLPGFDSLATGRTLIYYDQRGGGRSPVPRDVPVGWREQVADLEALRQVWGLERLSIAGYSWGALLALLYATEHPGRVSRLALVSPAPAWREARERFEAEFARRNLDPALQRERAALRESGLRERDPDAYARRVFELGSGFGYSTAFFARAVQENGGGVVHHVVWDEALSARAANQGKQIGIPPRSALPTWK